MNYITLPTLALFQLRNLHPLLWSILEDVIVLWPESTLRVTSIYRSNIEDARLGGTGVHATTPHRAIDLAAPVHGNATDTDKWAAVAHLATQLNERWSYDPTRLDMKVAIGSAHGTAPHLHLQVHPRTERAPSWNTVT